MKVVLPCKPPPKGSHSSVPFPKSMDPLSSKGSRYLCQTKAESGYQQLGLLPAYLLGPWSGEGASDGPQSSGESQPSQALQSPGVGSGGGRGVVQLWGSSTRR